MKTQWHIYQTLEQIPDAVLEPQSIHSPIVAWFDRWLRSRLDHRADKLDYEYQVEYLERRLALNYAHPPTKFHLWRHLWTVLNQPLLVEQRQSSHAEPEIQQTLDGSGQKWWKVYDPMTGQTAYLESESDVRIWLEDRLYH